MHLAHDRRELRCVAGVPRQRTSGARSSGSSRSSRFADDLWGSADPASRLSDGRPLHVLRDGEQYVLSIELPFTDADELDLTRNSDELFVAVGPTAAT